MPRNPASPPRPARVAVPAGPVAGVILAGGLSRRMGGGDKCLLPLGGRPILAHVIDRLRPQVGPLALNANGDPARFAAFGLEVVADDFPGFAGPLAGLLAGMDWAAARGLPLVVTAAADTPFFPRDLVARLRAAMAETGAPIALAATPAQGAAAGQAGAGGRFSAGGAADGETGGGPLADGMTTGGRSTGGATAGARGEEGETAGGPGAGGAAAGWSGADGAVAGGPGVNGVAAGWPGADGAALDGRLVAAAGGGAGSAGPVGVEAGAGGSGMAAGGGRAWAVAAGGGRRHPVFGLWSTALRADLREALGQGVRRVSEWAAGHGAAEAVFAGGEAAFFNVNAPDDLRRAERGLAAAP